MENTFDLKEYLINFYTENYNSITVSDNQSVKDLRNDHENRT